MLIKNTKLTRGLEMWLRGAHDDGFEPLRVSQIGLDVDVRPAEARELFETEVVEISALCAANAVEKHPACCGCADCEAAFAA